MLHGHKHIDTGTTQKYIKNRSIVYGMCVPHDAHKYMKSIWKIKVLCMAHVSAWHDSKFEVFVLCS